MEESFERSIWANVNAQVKEILLRPEKYCRVKSCRDLSAAASLRLRMEPTFGVSRSVSILASRRNSSDVGFEAVMAIWDKRHDERRVLDPVLSLQLLGRANIKPTVDFRVGFVADEKVSQFLAHLAELKIGPFKLRPSPSIDCTEWTCEFNDFSLAFSLSWTSQGPSDWTPFTKRVKNLLDECEQTLSLLSDI